MSHNAVILILPVLVLPSACSRPPIHQGEVPDAGRVSRTQPVKEQQSPMNWPKDWSDYVEKIVTIEGIAENMKVGAVLHGKGGTIFIDGLHSWPDGYYFGGERGKRLRVTGTVIERHDLPVFIPKKDELSVQGIPVPEGTDLHKASRRFLIQNAKWTVIE